MSTEKNNGFWYLCLGALGIVFGDIGTSPLYAFRECFGHEHGLALTTANVLGILSLILWTLIFVIGVKYIGFILAADNKGEGGILSLMALAMRTFSPDKLSRKWIVKIGLLGSALLYGDGIITPAISVLSAVEGLKVATPVFSSYVVPITCLVITVLFVFQFLGTGKIGTVFGPIILIWFTVLGVLGFNGILQNPSVLQAINPYHAVEFFIQNSWTGFFILGSVFLVVTGGEALYADMGHFGRKPIRLSWFLVAMPGLVLNYFGQGALVLNDPSAISQPFYLLAPKWGLIPLVILSTFATVIASQALISGVFSLTKQAVQLGYWPRVRVIHTSSKEMGQIYIPALNWLMLAGVLWLVLTFKNTSAMAAAYGIAVTGTMLITTALAFVVAVKLWNWGLFRAGLVFGAFFIVDAAFFVTNIVKVSNGGWVPLAIGASIYIVMSTWSKGRKILAERLRSKSLPIEDFLKQIRENPPLRIPGNAIYMSSELWGVPVPLIHNLKHNKVLHDKIALLTIKTKEVPKVKKEERVQIEELGNNFYRIVVMFGFMEVPKMKHILEACREKGIHFPVTETTFVLGRETLIPRGNPDLSLWRERLFAVMARNAERPTTYFKIPPNQVIEVGIQLEI